MKCVAQNALERTFSAGWNKTVATANGKQERPEATVAASWEADVENWRFLGIFGVCRRAHGECMNVWAEDQEAGFRDLIEMLIWKMYLPTRSLIRVCLLVWMTERTKALMFAGVAQWLECEFYRRHFELDVLQLVHGIDWKDKSDLFVGLYFPIMCFVALR